MTPLEAAIDLTRRGLRVVPVPHRSKNPGFRGWQHLRIDEDELKDHFDGRPQNIGVLLGEPSDWVVDVDLDHVRCIAFSDSFLPRTPAVFGRPGKPRSHRIYRVTSPVDTKKHKSKRAGMLVELRSTGTQTIFPPSTHENGESITWETVDAEPAKVDPGELLKAVESLANAVRTELGERAQRRGVDLASSQWRKVSKGDEKSKARTSRCLNAMLQTEMGDNKDGSSRLFAAACRVVEHDLGDAEGISVIRQYAALRPFPVSWTDEQILARLRDAEGKVRRGVIQLRSLDSNKTRIVIDSDEFRVASETIQSLGAAPNVYQRGGVLVDVVCDADHGDDIGRPAGSATIRRIPLPTLRETMTRHVEFSRFTRRGDVTIEVPTHPATWLVAAVDSRGEWPGIRYLAGISDSPVLRPDGSVFQEPGYDHRTGVLYLPAQGIRFPEIHRDSNVDDADSAKQQLLEVICDFPFESEEHRAAWVAALLTPIGRFAFSGPSPLFLIDANVRGAGKGLLAQTIGRIALGSDMPVSSYSRDSDEMRKKITTIAITGDRLILLDNLDGVFGNDVLDAALTGTRWKDRILGRNEQIDLPLTTVWYATGNNVQVGADTMRRVIHIRLDCLQELPEERTEFKHPDLLSWVDGLRPHLLCSALTILSVFLRSGTRATGIKAMGSFEGWSRVIREAVIWLGMPDPCLTRVNLAVSSDTSADALQQLIEAWQLFDANEEGVVVSAMLQYLYPPNRESGPLDTASVAMRSALENLIGYSPGKVPTGKQVGAKLRHYRRRVCRGYMIDSTAGREAQGKVWRLSRVG